MFVVRWEIVWRLCDELDDGTDVNSFPIVIVDARGRVKRLLFFLINGISFSCSVEFDDWRNFCSLNSFKSGKIDPRDWPILAVVTEPN